jgi:hypothetical protein
MAKKSTGVIFLVLIWASLTIIVPIQLLSYQSALFTNINTSLSFTFAPSSPSPIEKLYINADVGDVEVRYINPSVDYCVSIDVNIVINGVKIGKSYEDFLNVTWNNSSSLANLTVQIISNDWFNPLLWSFKDVSIVVTLRKDIVFDVITNLAEGNFEIEVPWAVSIGELTTNVSKGNILYNFESSSIQGNITCNINEGDLLIKSFDVEYAHNNRWDINIGKGNIKLEIYQYRDMLANITGIVKVNDGDVFILYEDDSVDVGAILEIPYGGPFLRPNGLPWCIRSSGNLTCTEVEGFDYEMIDSDEGIVYFTSFDLLTKQVKNYYSMRFEIGLEGSFAMSLLSEP